MASAAAKSLARATAAELKMFDDVERSYESLMPAEHLMASQFLKGLSKQRVRDEIREIANLSFRPWIHRFYAQGQFAAPYGRRWGGTSLSIAKRYPGGANYSDYRATRGRKNVHTGIDIAMAGIITTPWPCVVKKVGHNSRSGNYAILAPLRGHFRFSFVHLGIAEKDTDLIGMNTAIRTLSNGKTALVTAWSQELGRIEAEFGHVQRLKWATEGSVSTHASLDADFLRYMGDIVPQSKYLIDSPFFRNSHNLSHRLVTGTSIIDGVDLYTREATLIANMGRVSADLKHPFTYWPQQEWQSPSDVRFLGENEMFNSSLVEGMVLPAGYVIGMIGNTGHVLERETNDPFTRLHLHLGVKSAVGSGLNKFTRADTGRSNWVNPTRFKLGEMR